MAAICAARSKPFRRLLRFLNENGPLQGGGQNLFSLSVMEQLLSFRGPAGSSKNSSDTIPFCTIEDMTGRSEKGGKSYDHFCGELNKELIVGYDWMGLNRDVRSCHVYRKSHHIVTNHLLYIFSTCSSFSAQLSFYSPVLTGCSALLEYLIIHTLRSL